MQGLSQLFYLHGIGYDYTKYTGEHVIFNEQVREQALRCCGIDTRNHDEVEHLNYELDIAPWLRVVEDVCTVEQHDALFKIKVPDYRLDCCGYLKLKELPDYRQELDLSNARVVGEYLYQGVRYVEVAFKITPLPVGYFNAQLHLPWGDFETQIWSVPSECYNPITAKTTGISVQLYTLKSERNLGTGDFADLQVLIEQSVQVGCDYILLNPLHLLFETQHQRVSPYSPNHRALLNPLYIAVDRTAQYADSAQLQSLYAQSRAQLAHEKSQQYIDYQVVSECKYALLRALYADFKSFDDGSEIANQFSRFKVQHAEQLSVLGDDEQGGFWQFLAFQQLSECQQLSRRLGMQVGLINDLAVGCADDSLEFKANQELYVSEAHVGAPPDPWAENGQDWGLPALNPQKLKTDRYSFFRQLLRSNMSCVGGLRIDHVMAIRRLWWCFSVAQQQQGCYVYYPFEHLIALLKIESQLNKALVIGEDLGVVPPEIRTVMLDASMFGNTLFYFEKNQSDEFLPQQQLRQHVLLMVANHDVPPFIAWWQGDDIQLRIDYSLLEPSSRELEFEKRQQEKSKLLNWIHTCGFKEVSMQSSASEVYERLMLALAQSPSELLCIQLDDLDEQTLPVNIPGTYLEYPNWRRRLNHSVEEIFNKKGDFVATLTNSRKGL